ncbi:MAG TPA: tetratricopeptide repeat protein [Rhizomicrobium sp.]|nr:tetratricopeptide repeat protein [Rhizomicrobium sp.]
MSDHARADAAQKLVNAYRLFQSDDSGEAERICRAVLSEEPHFYPAMNLLAVLLGHRGALAEAEILARQALVQAPQDPALYNTLGNLLFKRGDHAGAKAAYDLSLALNPDQAEAHYNLGLVLNALGKADGALAALRRAVVLRPDYTEALTEIGARLRDQGQHEESLAVLEQALAAAPRYFPALYYRGLGLLSLHRYEEAAASLQTAVRLRPQSHEAQHALGNALSYDNRETEAISAYQKAIEAAPGFVNAHVDYNALVWTMGLREAQWKSFAYARHKLGDVPNLMLAESEQRLRLSDPVAAEALLRRAVAIAPGRADIENALGRALTGRGNFDAAIDLFQSAAARQSDNPAHYREWAVALLHDRKPDRALPILERAQGFAPVDQFILGLITLAYRETGDPRYAALADTDKYVRAYRLRPPAGFSDTESFNRELAEELSHLHTRRVEPHDQTLRGGTQTAGNLFAHPSRNIGRLRERIEEAVADYIAAMPDAPAHPLFGRRKRGFAFSGSWSCQLHSQGFHTNHLHPQGWISSAYYVSVPDAVTDRDTRQGWIKFGESNLQLGEKDRPGHLVQPATGLLVLFPSYFWHGTVPFQSSQARLTVAFDVVPALSGQTVS